MSDEQKPPPKKKRTDEEDGQAKKPKAKELNLDELEDVVGGTSSDVAGPKDQVGHN